MFDPTKGRIVTNVTSITLVNATAKTEDVTVPAGKRWVFCFLSLTNPDNVVRDVTINLYKEAAKTNLLIKLNSKVGMEASAAKRYVFPSNAAANFDDLPHPSIFPLLLDSGMTISVVWATGGASAGGTDADGLVVYVVEYDL